MKTGVVAVALAASTLLAAPATAQQGNRGDRAVPDRQLRGGPTDTFRGNGFNGRQSDFGRNDFRGDRSRRGQNNRNRSGFKKVRLNAFGQTLQEEKFLADKAIYACACQLEADAHRYGYKAARFSRTPHYEQVGKNKFIIKGTARLNDGYQVSRQNYDCNVRRGNIRQASQLYPVSFRGNRNGGRSGFGRIGVSFGNVW